MENALILVEPAEMSAAGRLEKVLAVFGIASRRLTVPEFLAAATVADEKLKFRLLGTAAVFLKLTAALEENSAAGANWRQAVHSAFIFSGDDPTSFEKLAKQLTRDDQARLAQVDQGAHWRVSDQLPEFCQVMSGLRVTAVNQADRALVFDAAKSNAAKIIVTEKTAALLWLEFESVPVFLSTAGIIDVDAPLAARVFDIRPHFLAAVPVVLYAKWAFAESCWKAPEVNACLVIDDPLLQPTYGYVNYAKFLSLMQRHSFSTNIAFIPWNWARSRPEVVRLFQKHPENFSLSVHGCDHTAGEFGRPEKSWLARRSTQALERMERHAAKTGIVHDRVMVLPQGVFTDDAPGVFKQSGFSAIVNSEVFTTDPQPRPITIASFWDVAVMDYDCFPIYTRREPTEGVENFAFDILLGKPCIVLIHHDFCWDGCDRLVKAINQINALPGKINWRSLGEVVRRGFRQKVLADGGIALEMYGTELRLENHSPQLQRFMVSKRETEPALIQEILADKNPVAWKNSDGRVIFQVELGPGQSQIINIKFHAMDNPQPAADGIYYRFKTGLRRHLCEMRDNYVTKIKFAIRPPTAS